MDFSIALPTPADSWKIVKRAEDAGFNGPVANFSRPVCDPRENADDITFGCGGGFLAAVFLPVVASMRVQQSATPLQIVPGKTLRQAQKYSRVCELPHTSQPLVEVFF